MAGRQWSQVQFEERLDEWIELERPGEHLRRVVTAWTLSRLDDPHRGLQRAPGFEDLWLGRVPGTLRDGTVVVCSLWIDELAGVVRCDRIGTLSWPI